MKRTLSLFLALCIMMTSAMALTGCSSNNNNEFPVTIGDVTIEAEPARVIVLNDSVADIISCIGYDLKIVGRSVECDQDFLSVIPSVGTPDNPSIDTVVNRAPDLVIADNTLPEKAKAKIEHEGIKVITLGTASTHEELRELYITVGTVLGGNITGREKGEKAYDDLYTMLDQFQSVQTGVVTTAVYLYIEQNGQLCTFVKGSLEQELFEYNGAMNSFTNQTEAAIDSAELRMAQPTYIFYDGELDLNGNVVDDSVIEYLRNDENLSRLSALQNDRLCCIPLKYFYRQGKTYKQVVYDMIDFMYADKSVSTPDEEATEAEASEGSLIDDSADDDEGAAVYEE